MVESESILYLLQHGCIYVQALISFSQEHMVAPRKALAHTSHPKFFVSRWSKTPWTESDGLLS